MAISFPVFFVLIAAAAAPLLVVSDDSNVLLTGEVLPTNGQLSNGKVIFVMQGDCNLVLYNYPHGFQSNTAGNGVNCTLTLDDHGQLIIKSGASGRIVWTSRTRSAEKGNYAAVMRPDGQVVVYGPSLWSTPQLASTSTRDIYKSELTGIIPMVRNVLFSSQTLYNGAALATRDNLLTMTNDCNLELTKAGHGVVWQSGTAGKGKHCFVRLDHRGQLTVADDQYRVLWASKPVGKQDGDYALILEIQGQAVVYGPDVWSTASGGPHVWSTASGGYAAEG